MDRMIALIRKPQWPALIAGFLVLTVACGRAAGQPSPQPVAVHAEFTGSGTSRVLGGFQVRAFSGSADANLRTSPPALRAHFDLEGSGGYDVALAEGRLFRGRPGRPGPVEQPRAQAELITRLAGLVGTTNLDARGSLQLVEQKGQAVTRLPDDTLDGQPYQHYRLEGGWNLVRALLEAQIGTATLGFSLLLAAPAAAGAPPSLTADVRLSLDLWLDPATGFLRRLTYRLDARGAGSHITLDLTPLNQPAAITVPR